MGLKLVNWRQTGSQARACWQWVQHHRVHAEAAGNDNVIINLDESFIGDHLADKKRFVCKWGQNGEKYKPPPSQDLNLHEKSLGLTYVGLIANNYAVQQVLLQILIASGKDFSLRSCRLINAGMAPNFYFVRGPSKWIDKRTMIWTLRLMMMTTMMIIMTMNDDDDWR